METTLTKVQEEQKAALLQNVLIGGDLSKLSEAQKLDYYLQTCTSLGLNPLTKPFGYIQLNGKLTLYAQKDCTDQIRNIKAVSITSLEGRIIDELYVVTATGKNKEGRTDCSTGVVDIKGKQGEAKANCMMKAETKAKRRLTLSLCGLGILDESEVDSIKDAKIISEPEIPKNTVIPPAVASTASPMAKSGQETPVDAEFSPISGAKPAVPAPLATPKASTQAISAERIEIIKAGLRDCADKKTLNAVMKSAVREHERTPEVMAVYQEVLEKVKNT